MASRARGGGEARHGTMALRHLSKCPGRARADAAARRAPKGFARLADAIIPTHADGKAVELCSPNDLAHAVQLPELIITPWDYWYYAITTEPPVLTTRMIPKCCIEACLTYHVCFVIPRLRRSQPQDPLLERF